MNSTAEYFVGDGRQIGYCMICGGDVFNGPRHRCPRRVSAEARFLIMAAKRFVDAELAIRSASSGSLMNKKACQVRDDLFDALVSAISDHNAKTTIGSVS